jgi:hypothetical protein
VLADRLAKLAAVSAALRGKEKTAIIASALGAAARGIGNLGMKAAGGLARYGSKSVGNAATLGIGGLVAVGGAKGAAQKYKQYKGGFDPQASQALQGQTPIPPGAG